MLFQVEPRAQGQAAEDRFRAWLDRCRLAHLYIDQSPFTFLDLHGKIKRPDFLVGIPTIGTIAVDVKAKRIYLPTPSSSMPTSTARWPTLRRTSISASGSPASRPTNRTFAT